MKRFNIIKTVSAAAFTTTLLFTSCTGNFDELNMHPTDLYPENMTPTERGRYIVCGYDSLIECLSGK